MTYHGNRLYIEGEIEPEVPVFTSLNGSPRAFCPYVYLEPIIEAVSEPPSPDFFEPIKYDDKEGK